MVTKNEKEEKTPRSIEKSKNKNKLSEKINRYHDLGITMIVLMRPVGCEFNPTMTGIALIQY